MGRLSTSATSGAHTHKIRMPAATGNAAGRIMATSSAAPIATSGLASMFMTNVRAVRSRQRCAPAADVSHSSRRPRDIVRRTSVMPTACSISQAWLAMNVSCSITRAASARRSSKEVRAKMPHV